MEEKVTEILFVLKKLTINSAFDLKSLQWENKQLKLHQLESDGIISKLSQKVEKLEEKLTTMEAHSMSKNVVIYKLQETPDENVYSKVQEFIVSALKIPRSEIFSCENPSANIRIDVAHRIGVKGNKPRPVVVSFTTRRGRDVVLSCARHLQSTPYSISEQLPKMMRERRTAQIPFLTSVRKEARETGSNAKAILSKDKLFINGTRKTDSFESNPLKYITVDSAPISYDQIQSTLPVEVKGSCFQGYSHCIHTRSEGSSVLRALNQNLDTVSCDHIIYACSTTDLDGKTISGHSDGEWGAGTILHDLLQVNNANDCILIVTRKFGGDNLGKQRFDLIRKSAIEALTSLNGK